MEPLQAIILGIVQGLTEFLPVSSSGHLVIGQHLFGFSEAALAFDVSVHLGTLAAVLFFFRRDLFEIGNAFFKGLRQGLSGRKTWRKISADPPVTLGLLIVAGSVPTAVLGLLFRSMADEIFGSLFLVGSMLIITGCLLWVTRYKSVTTTKTKPPSLPKALAIGLIQGIAVLPGISRSGATITAGLFMGLSHASAVRFSFLLSIPAVAGAGLLELKGLVPSDDAPLSTLLWGAISAAIVGYFSLKFLVYIVNRGQMHRFAPYCWIVAIFALVLGWW